MNIQFSHEKKVTEAAFVELLKRSTLAERRPLADAKAISAMLQHANLVCTAWDAQKLVGVARSLTDFEYCCYLSDLAVDEAYQKQGIGRELIRLTQSRLSERAKIILLSAPQAVEYYPKLGFRRHDSAWVISAGQTIP